MRVIIFLQEYNMSTILLEFGEPTQFHGTEMHFLKNPIRYVFEVKFIIIIIIINNILATGKYSTFEFWIENGQYSKA